MAAKLSDSDSSYCPGPGDDDDSVGLLRPKPPRFRRFHAALHGIRTSLKPSHQYGRFPWGGVLWRFATATMFSIQTMAVLYSFAGRESLTPWERRAFNTLTILFSGLVSLTLGSLLGLLGSVLRWRLLARASTTPRDVDMILGMHNPTGALKLLCHHLSPSGKWSNTTAIVLLYLIVNIVVRLSVAAFGLTYDLNENVGVEYPAEVVDFSSPNWIYGNQYDRNIRRLNEFVVPGFWLVPTEFDPEHPLSHRATNISGSGLNRTVERNSVTYSYPLKEFHGLNEAALAGKVVRTSSSCVGRTYHGDAAGNGSVYYKGNLEEMPEEVADAPYYLQALNVVLTMDPSSSCFWTRFSGDDKSTICNSAYLLKYEGLHKTTNVNNQTEYEFGKTVDATLYECKSCLVDQSGNPGLDPNTFHGFPAANIQHAIDVLLTAGVSDAWAQAAVGFSDVLWHRTSAYECQKDDKDFMSDIEALSFKNHGKDFYKSAVPLGYELRAAHVVGRGPILAVAGAEKLLPKVLKEEGASERPYITTSLEVKWARSLGVLGAIFIGQLLAIGVVFSYTAKKVILRDHDSYLAMARLLRTAVDNCPAKGRSTDSGEEIARQLQQNQQVGDNGINAKIIQGL
ncbi:hypothetical protein DL771_009755 [Monosporascus sp. 5C6A]|nr:hypothetical protein DL771_009755 [Monosporascus sp. 5C6A]